MVRVTALSVCMVLAGSAHARSADAELPGPVNPASWEIAPEIYSFTYKEPGVMKEEGTFYGLIGSHTWWRQRSSVRRDPATASDDAARWSTFKIEGRFSWGQVDYDGALSSGEPYTINDIDDYVIGVAVLWGRVWEPPRFINGFHIGIAYRYLNDDTSFDPYGYERESNYLYAPLRLEAAVGSTNTWQVGFTGELDVLLIGLQISHLGDVMPDPDVDPDTSNIYNWQIGGVGAQGAVALRHKSETLDLAVAPFVRYWWIAESQPDRGWVEPENNTLEYGLRLIWRF